MSVATPAVPAVVAAARKVPSHASPPPSASPRALPGEKKLLDRGRTMLDGADVSGARLVFQHLAFQGSAAAAFAMAQSYDATFLARLNVVGTGADAVKASHWYQRAAENGSTEAQVRLKEIRAGQR